MNKKEIQERIIDEINSREERIELFKTIPGKEKDILIAQTEIGIFRRVNGWLKGY